MHSSPFVAAISLLFVGVVVGFVSAQGIPVNPSIRHGHHRRHHGRHHGHHRHKHKAPQNGIPKQIVPRELNGGQVQEIPNGIGPQQAPQNGITKEAVPAQSSGGAQAIINSNIPPQVPENNIPKQPVPEKPNGAIIVDQIIDTAKFFGIAILEIASNSNPLLFAQEVVAAHNWVRIKYNLPLFTWDEKLASYARQYAMQRYNDCQMLHSGGPYGENLFWGAQLHWRGTDAVYYWYKEQEWYNFSTLTCLPPAGKSCGHFTQIVWRDSLRVGCARQLCRPDLQGMLIVCEYDPPGNYDNENPLLNNNARVLNS